MVSNWQTTTGTGGAIGVFLSNLILDSGVTSGATVGVQSGNTDYLPLVVEFYISVSQAIANQLIVFGVQDIFEGNANQEVTVQLSGTNPAVGNFVTSSADNSSDRDTIPFTFPNNTTSSPAISIVWGFPGIVPNCRLMM